MSNEQNEKTEEATPRKKEKERDRGNIAKSQDFSASLMLTLGVCLLFVLGKSMLESLRTTLFDSFVSLNPDNISDNDFFAIITPYYIAFIKITAGFFSFLALGAIIIQRIQTGSLFAKEALKPNFQKLAPGNLVKNLMNKINFFKPKQLVELAKSLAKTTVVALV